MALPMLARLLARVGMSKVSRPPSGRQRAAKANVAVDVRWSVVPIGGEHAGVRAIVPVATAEEGVLELAKRWA